MDPLVWAGILLALGLTLTVLELFVPSGGILGLISLVSLVVSVGLAFRHGAWTGLGFLAAVVLGVPVGLSLGLRYWPETPMGRRLLLDIPKSEEVLPDRQARRALRDLVGKVGVAKSLMMPSGAVQVEGRTIDALSDGLTIEPGQRIRVVEVRGTRVVVRSTDDEPAPVKSNDPLSQSIESLGLDPFEDPLA
jgi:membrane-bound ClpP family serine protease